MKKSLKKQALKANFVFVLFVLIILFLMFEMGKISTMQKNERDNTELAQQFYLVKKTSELVKGITAASMEQKNSTELVSEFSQNLNEITQQNSEASQTMEAQSDRLVLQTEKLQKRISFFKL